MTSLEFWFGSLFFKKVTSSVSALNSSFKSSIDEDIWLMLFESFFPGIGKKTRLKMFSVFKAVQKTSCYLWQLCAAISVEESPSWLGKTTKKVWSFLTIPIKKLFVLHFILALFGKNVLLTSKIKNTNLVALESVESLYHNFGLQINNKNVPIFN